MKVVTKLLSSCVVSAVVVVSKLLSSCMFIQVVAKLLRIFVLAKLFVVHSKLLRSCEMLEMCVIWSIS